MLKVLTVSLGYIAAATGVLAANNAAVFGIPATWIIGILVTILVAVLTAMGAIIKIAYDTAHKWDAVLSGQEGVEDDSGFITRSQNRHEELQGQHEKVYDQLLVQGQLLSELTYAFSDIAEELDDNEDIDVNVHLDRIHKLRERKEEKRWEDEDEDGGAD